MAEKKGARGAPKDSSTGANAQGPDASIAGARHTTSGGDSTVGAQGSSVKNTRGVVTMVCITCGAEQFFSDKMPTGLKCPRCSGTVFRQFDTPTDADEATISGLEEQARSIQWGDSSPQTTADDVRDLDER